MKGLSNSVSVALMLLIVFVLVTILGIWANHFDSKVLNDSYNNYLNATKNTLASIFNFFRFK